MEIIRGHHCSIFMCVCVCMHLIHTHINIVSLCVRMSSSVCVCNCQMVVNACLSPGHVERRSHVSAVYSHLHVHSVYRLYGRTVSLWFKPLLIVLELFNRKPSEIWLSGDSCTDNSSLMLALCHS